ncbi:MAG TPA: methionyl-tRNA formyltransferase [Thermoanaerobaculia bacterium]|nr:methionyl-tRNA formyltransferase [Thermoanaerobaculia bacterium]
MRVVFFGTPDFAVPTLEALAREHAIALVVAQPDKPAGRGMKMQEPPVVTKARALGLEISQPPKIRDEEFLQRIRTIAPDAAVVIAYGRILPKNLLEIPRLGFLNVHASVLPKYRGAAPIQRAIEAGESSTGVTIMRVDEELDHGPMLAVERIDISDDEHAPSVSRRLSQLGAELLVRVLRDVPPATPQDHSKATYAPKIEKREGLVTFSESTENIYNRFRAFDPWPGIFFESRGEVIKIVDMKRAAGIGAATRVIDAIDDHVVIGGLRLLALQRPGKPRAPAGDVARGLGWRVGAALP